MNEPTRIKIDDVEYVRADSVSQADVDTDGKPYVIVRSRNQGVMSGYLVSIEGQTVTLLRARQFYYWKSRYLLPDLAEFGPEPGCKFSAEMSQPMIMTEACGVLHCTAAAGAAIRSVPPQVKS